MPVNEFGQPVGAPLEWLPGPVLVPTVLTGRHCVLEPLGERHVPGLYAALCVDSSDSIWTYMSAGPFPDHDSFAAHVSDLLSRADTVPLAVLLPGGTPVGIATYLRVDHANGTAEVGNITYASVLQRSTAATEAMYLMAAHAFDVIGVRRYEWKCDALNQPSRDAAARLGFTFEGIFRQAVVYKGRNRDTAWFAVTDADWPRLRARYEQWLDPANFTADGTQRTPLADLG